MTNRKEVEDKLEKMQRELAEREQERSLAISETARIGKKLKKMQRVLVGLLEDCKLNLDAVGGCDHEVGICVCGIISLIADAEQALADLEVRK